MEQTWKPLIDRDEFRRHLMEISDDSVKAFASRIRNNDAFRRGIVSGYDAWVVYFRACARNPVLFRSDPSRIDRFLTALSIDAESLGPDDFPPLNATIAELERIAAETVRIRRTMAAEDVRAALLQTQIRPLA